MKNEYNQVLTGIVRVRNDPDITADNVLHKMALACGVQERHLLSGRRDQRTSMCRQGIMWVLREMEFSYTEIGQRLARRDLKGNDHQRDHTTIIYGISAIIKRLAQQGISLDGSDKDKRLPVLVDRRYGFPTLALCGMVHHGREQRGGYALRRGNAFQRFAEDDLGHAISGLGQWAFYNGEPVVEMNEGRPCFVYRPIDLSTQTDLLYRLSQNGTHSS